VATFDRLRVADLSSHDKTGHVCRSASPGAAMPCLWDIRGSISQEGIAVSATGTVRMIFCVKESTGTDLGAIFQSVVTGLSQLPPVISSEIPVTQVVQVVPGLVEAIDSARSDPDDLYVTASTEGELSNAIWPFDDNGEPTTVDIQAGQSVAPDVSVDFDFSQNLSLFDFDTVSADDLLGSITMLESEQGAGPITKLAMSRVEGSAYYITYSVD
jgi:hypothetical protein